MANEVAVAAFLQDQISFEQITQVIEEMLSQIESKQLDDLDEVMAHIELVKQKTIMYVGKL